MYGHKVGKSAMSYGHKVNVSANSYGHKVARVKHVKHPSPASENKDPNHSYLEKY
jgi:hypothetical protein